MFYFVSVKEKFFSFARSAALTWAQWMRSMGMACKEPLCPCTFCTHYVLCPILHSSHPGPSRPASRSPGLCKYPLPSSTLPLPRIIASIALCCRPV